MAEIVYSPQVGAGWMKIDYSERARTTWEMAGCSNGADWCHCDLLLGVRSGHSWQHVNGRQQFGSYGPKPERN